MWPSWTALSSILPRASITNTNSKGDNGSPCLNPLELSKNPQGEPFIKTEKRTVDIQKNIHCRHLAENPLFSSNCIRKPQFTWSKAFSTSNLQSSPGNLDFNLLSRHSLAISIGSRICQFLTKAFCEAEIISSMTVQSLLAKTLAIIL